MPARPRQQRGAITATGRPAFTRLVASSLGALALCSAGCDRDVPPAPARPAFRRPDAPGEPLHVRVTGHDFGWRIRYPGLDGALDTPDDITARRNLLLPAATDIVLELTSDDYVYSLYLPAFELVEMAFPGQPFLMEFSTAEPGISRLMGAQNCGYAHQDLLGKLEVVTPAEFGAVYSAP